jgi:hypothetical protein
VLPCSPIFKFVSDRVCYLVRQICKWRSVLPCSPIFKFASDRVCYPVRQFSIVASKHNLIHSGSWCHNGRGEIGSGQIWVLQNCWKLVLRTCMYINVNACIVKRTTHWAYQACVPGYIYACIKMLKGLYIEATTPSLSIWNSQIQNIAEMKYLKIWVMFENGVNLALSND